MAKQIDLNEARIPSNSEVITGRDCGEEFRRRFQLDALDVSEDEAVVSIPAAVVSINTSFFLGLFGPSVRRLGPERFLSKYKFQCDDVHMATVREGMIRAAKEQSIFGEKKTAA
jgi:hypothetical protein